jgi:paraquat-inducible protein A
MASKDSQRAQHLILSCSDCGTLQQHPGAGAALTCITCKNTLERSSWRSLDAALATASATFLFLIPANLMTLLSASVIGVTRQSLLISSATEIWAEGWPLLAAVIALFLVILPLVRFGLLTLVLGCLRLGVRARWLGPAFQTTVGLATWAMPDVFLLGLWIAYARLSATLSVSLGPGGLCFIAAGLLALFNRATLNTAEIWRQIHPSAAQDLWHAVTSCETCELVVPATELGRRCLRCRSRLHARKVNGTVRAAALTAAGLLLYVPANLYAMATIPIGIRPTGYTVLQGVLDLVDARLYALAALVFSASFAIPLLKLVGMTWFIWSIWRRSSRALRARTRFYRVVEEIGRWSMVDPFTIACFVPVMQINAALYGRAGPAATAFTGVVVMTMAAAKLFDPRAMWDIAEMRR